jgi:flagellar motor switch/type III secretory pathway protein FliN
MQTSIKLQTPLKFNFIKATAESVRFHNEIIGYGKSIPFKLKNDAYELFFLHQKPMAYETKVFFKLSLNKQAFYLGLSPAPSLQVLDTALKDLSLQNLPPDVLALLFESFSGEIFKGIDSKLKADLSLEDVTFFPPKELFDYKLHIRIVNHTTKAEYLGHFWLNQNLMSIFAEWIAQNKPLKQNSLLNKVLLKGQVRLGMCALKREEFCSLEKNDILLLDDSADIQKQIYSLVFNQALSLKFQYQNEKATFIKMSETPPNIPISPTPVKAVPAPKPSPAEAKPPEAVPAPNLAKKLETLEVLLSFEVGEKALSIEALRSISPGFTFELENPAQKPVVIKLNGNAIGRGELLQIGEKVGVRVMDFSHNE